MPSLSVSQVLADEFREAITPRSPRSFAGWCIEVDAPCCACTDLCVSPNGVTERPLVRLSGEAEAAMVTKACDEDEWITCYR